MTPSRCSFRASFNQSPKQEAASYVESEGINLVSRYLPNISILKKTTTLQNLFMCSHGNWPTCEWTTLIMGPTQTAWR